MDGRIDAGWIATLSLVLAVLSSLAAGFHVRRNLVLENLALRHQLLVLKRSIKNPALRNSDRLFWAALSVMWSRWTKALVIVQPQTVVRWHQTGFRLFWRWRSRRRSGRTPKDRELIDLIRRMWQANPTWGSPRIRAELAKLGLHVSVATVRKYRPKRERGRPATHRRRLLHGAHGHVPRLVCLCRVGPRAPEGVAFCGHRGSFGSVGRAANRQRVPFRNAAEISAARSRWHLRSGVHQARDGPRDRGKAHCAARAVAESMRRKTDRDHPPGMSGSGDCHRRTTPSQRSERLLRLLPPYSSPQRSLAQDSPVPRPVMTPEQGAAVEFPQVGGLHHLYKRQAA